jgi:hypothetical protein
MLKTRLCELLGLDVPIILAPMGRARRLNSRPRYPTREGWVASDRCFGPPQPSNATLMWYKRSLIERLRSTTSRHVWMQRPFVIHWRRGFGLANLRKYQAAGSGCVGLRGPGAAFPLAPAARSPARVSRSIEPTNAFASFMRLSDRRRASRRSSRRRSRWPSPPGRAA